jgi:hypothetical protein
MRFMLIRKADAKTEAGVLPTEPLMAAMGQYMEEMSKAGILLAGEGLLASSKGARVKFSAGKPRVIDGPFPETGQLIGGFCIIQVGSKQAAIDWVKRWPALDGDGNLEVEIRQVAEAEDFGPEFTKEMSEAEDRMRAEAAARR